MNFSDAPAIAGITVAQGPSAECLQTVTAVICLSALSLKKQMCVVGGTFPCSDPTRPVPEYA